MTKTIIQRLDDIDFNTYEAAKEQLSSNLDKKVSWEAYFRYLYLNQK